MAQINPDQFRDLFDQMRLDVSRLADPYKLRLMPLDDVKDAKDRVNNFLDLVDDNAHLLPSAEEDRMNRWGGLDQPNLGIVPEVRKGKAPSIPKFAFLNRNKPKTS